MFSIRHQQTDERLVLKMNRSAVRANMRRPIGQLHDDDICLQLPEFISVLLCYLNLSIPLRIKEQ